MNKRDIIIDKTLCNKIERRFSHRTVADVDLSLLASNKKVDRADNSSCRFSSTSVLEVPVTKACKKYLHRDRNSPVVTLFSWSRFDDVLDDRSMLTEIC